MGLPDDDAIESFYDSNFNQQSFPDWNYSQQIKAIQLRIRMPQPAWELLSTLDISLSGNLGGAPLEIERPRFGIATATSSKYRGIIIKFPDDFVEVLAQLLGEKKTTFEVAYRMSGLTLHGIRNW